MGEAAVLLGISKDAVRMRIRRGTLRSEKTDDRVYVWLDDDLNVDQDTVHHADEAPAYRELIEQLRSEVEAWREEARRKDHIIAGLIERLPPQLEAPRDQPPDEREADLTASVDPEASQPRPTTPGPQETSESPESAADEQQGRGPVPDAPGPQEPAQQAQARPWWRRLLEG